MESIRLLQLSNETIPMHLMLGASLGTVTFDIVGELAFKCAR